MKKFTLENAMIKAIQQFKKNHKDFTIRCVYAYEWCNSKALFLIEYVDEQGEYHEETVNIKAND